MKNLLISDLNKKDVDNFTSDYGLYLRRITNKPFIKMCNVFTNANIIRLKQNSNLSDEEYFNSLDLLKIDPLSYPIKKDKNNIIVERYPNLEDNEAYIFVANHTFPEDIETFLNIIDRNSYLVLGSIETLKYNPEMYLSWLNGMIPFDILNQQEREYLPLKMQRVLYASNSILIFPEGSHNYHPNKIINNLFDGPVNLALKTHKKIVLLTLVRDEENNISYIDASNPIDVSNLNICIKDYYPREEENEKYYIKSISSFLRDKMATAVYYMINRHLDIYKRSYYYDVADDFKKEYIQEAFSGLKWQHDCFEAEYLVKKTKEEIEYEEVANSISNLISNNKNYRNNNLANRECLNKAIDLEKNNVANYMREYWISECQDEIQRKELKRGG